MHEPPQKYMHIRGRSITLTDNRQFASETECGIDNSVFPWLVIFLSAFITILVVILSILGQTIRIANRNPIEGIKTE